MISAVGFTEGRPIRGTLSAEMSTSRLTMTSSWLRSTAANRFTNALAAASAFLVLQASLSACATEGRTSASSGESAEVAALVDGNPIYFTEVEGLLEVDGEVPVRFVGKHDPLDLALERAIDDHLLLLAGSEEESDETLTRAERIASALEEQGIRPPMYSDSPTIDHELTSWFSANKDKFAAVEAADFVAVQTTDASVYEDIVHSEASSGDELRRLAAQHQVEHLEGTVGDPIHDFPPYLQRVVNAAPANDVLGYDADGMSEEYWVVWIGATERADVDLTRELKARVNYAMEWDEYNASVSNYADSLENTWPVAVESENFSKLSDVVNGFDDER